MIHRLKAAVFGTGFVGRVHLEGIRRLGFVQVYAIGESQKEKARRLAEEFHVEKAASDYHQFWTIPKWMSFTSARPNALHFPDGQGFAAGRQARDLRKAAGHLRRRGERTD